MVEFFKPSDFAGRSLTAQLQLSIGLKMIRFSTKVTELMGFSSDKTAVNVGRTDTGLFCFEKVEEETVGVFKVALVKTQATIYSPKLAQYLLEKLGVLPLVEEKKYSSFVFKITQDGNLFIIEPPKKYEKP